MVSAMFDASRIVLQDTVEDSLAAIVSSECDVLIVDGSFTVDLNPITYDTSDLSLGDLIDLQLTYVAATRKPQAPSPPPVEEEGMGLFDLIELGLGGLGVVLGVVALVLICGVKSSISAVTTTTNPMNKHRV
eukprot:gnl/Dysnectes_brevis/9087_a16645_152.p1 GENE.gnl/Dysnectes_brevis/9087_a16645_152~~gnl/Dysnectes_brevis/9087_a16645_152.p1  ORF type:complete len:132 (-),score=67.54 gnl/Dysnectes_brevis/9087_a16645_152:44-439(-)